MLRNLPGTLLLSLPFLNSALASYCKLNPRSSLNAAPAKPSAPVNNKNNNGVDDSNVVAAAWYPGWQSDTYNVEDISWDNYNVVTYAFGTTTPDVTAIDLSGSNETALPLFVQAAHDHGVDAFLSIGGWTGSQYFSTAVATASNRTQFVKTVTDLATKYNLDGIDFDWEYPNNEGIGCNTKSGDDSANFLSFLQELRDDPVGQALKLSAAVRIEPFYGPDGVTSMQDVSGFAQVLDWIAIMNYDIWGAWSNTVGPNAPLDDSCAPQQAGSAESAVKAWTAASFPASQIVLGVASYGHSFSVQSSAAIDSAGSLVAYPAFNKNQQPKGDSLDGVSTEPDQCGNPPTGMPSGEFNFWGLVQGGFLGQDGEADAGSGILYMFDNCSQTPYVYNKETNVMVSYDDATSFAAKGRFINDAGLLGFAMWDSTGDYNNILLDSISNSMNIVLNCTTMD